MRLQTNTIERSQGQGAKIRDNTKQTTLLDWIGQQEGQKNIHRNPKVQQITHNKQGASNRPKRNKTFDAISKIGHKK